MPTAKSAAKPRGPLIRGSKVEVYAWWLKQHPITGRTWRAVAEKFGIAPDTAQNWVAAFNRHLREQARASVDAQLRQYREEYEAIQSETLGVVATLVQAVKVNANEIRMQTEKGGMADPKLLRETASVAKQVYDLAESVTGADLAKKAAARSIAEGNADSVRASMPDLAHWAAGDPELFLDAESEALDESQQAFSPDRNPENGPGEAGSSAE